VVLYGCQTWSLTLKAECRLRVFENRVRRRIFGPKRDEVTGRWIRLNRGASCSLHLTRCYSDYQIKKNEMGGECSTYGRQERCIQGFDGET
jgi:hypothetical protein